MAEVVEEAPASALAIYAHPDDPEVSCGGTLARWAAAGTEVMVCICADGDKGSLDPTVDGATLAALRREEVNAAGEILGVAGHHFLGYGDGGLEDDAELRGRLVALIRALKPEAVLCPDPTAVFFGQHYANHRDHRVVGWATLDAVAPAAANPHYFPAAGPAHQASVLYLSGTVEPDAWVDITSMVERKAQAVACHASQVGEPGAWLRTVVRQRAEAGGRRAGVAYAEGFRRLLLRS
ncbi:MAG: PIG-L family deacetylase [Actinomycetota bacterium]|nr:PIG-L family deacetylase [Actinomycetota bacterium]MDQ6946995.1 PIG-L family deacetylase [Actinomycetota bacterium]